jgi:Domain of unknown function (DUF1998)
VVDFSEDLDLLEPLSMRGMEPERSSDGEVPVVLDVRHGGLPQPSTIWQTRWWWTTPGCARWWTPSMNAARSSSSARLAPARGAVTTTGLVTHASRMALASLVEALGLAASRTLQIDGGELSGWWTPVMGGRPDEAQLYLYDLLPGGAGLARAVGNALPEVLDAAESLLGGCDCPPSCYRCIRHYGNNWIHASLDRHLALALLRHVRAGVLPSLTDQDKDRALVALRQLLALRGLACEENANLADTRVPLIIQLPNSRVCVDVHHPQFLEVVSLNAFDLLHDLPAAVARLKLPSGAAG